MSNSPTERASDMRPINGLAARGMYRGEIDFTKYKKPLHRSDGPHPLIETLPKPKRIGRLQVLGTVDRKSLGVGKRGRSVRCDCGYYEIMTTAVLKSMEIGRTKARCSRCEYAGSFISDSREYQITSAEAQYVLRAIQFDKCRTAKNLREKLTAPLSHKRNTQ